MDDELLMAVKKSGGVVQIVGFASYLKADSKERAEALSKLRADLGFAQLGAFGGRAGAAPRPCSVEDEGSTPAAGGRSRGAGFLNLLPPDIGAAYQAGLAEIDAKFPPPPRANVQDLVNHIDYAVKLIGIDHVGISSDFDGGGGIDGWNGADEAFNVTLELVRRGYTRDQIGKLWSGNLLRVWVDVEKVAKKLQKK
jgi:membrane dipeptidase